MKDGWITLVGMLAGTLTAASWLPQVAKTWKTRSAGDFSWGYIATFTAGVLMWLAYGALMRDPAVVVANIVTFGLLLIVISVKAKE